jgi:IS1 family transposase
MICPCQKMDRIRIARSELELKLKERDFWDVPENTFKQELADIKKKGSCQEIEKNDCGGENRLETFRRQTFMKRKIC